MKYVDLLGKISCVGFLFSFASFFVIAFMPAPKEYHTLAFGAFVAFAIAFWVCLGIDEYLRERKLRA